MHGDRGERERGTVDWKSDICAEGWMKRPRARLREQFFSVPPDGWFSDHYCARVLSLRLY